MVRKSLNTIGAKILLGDEVTLAVDDNPLTWRRRKHCNRLLKNCCQQNHMEALVLAKDQGRTFSTVRQHPMSNHWIPSGMYMSFSEYRFGLKARLNLLPVKMVQCRFQPTLTDTRCRRCHQHAETLSHVLNHCHHNMGLIHQRHSHILA